MAHDLGLLEAVGAGLLQGVATVFPISGLGHGVLVGSLSSGSDLAPERAGYLYASLRLAIGVALLGFFRHDWLRIARGLAGRGSSGDRRWSGLVLLAVLPGCVAVVVLDRYAGHVLHHPRIAAGGLIGNGVLMVAVWRWWRRSPRAGGMSGAHRVRLTRTEDAQTLGAELAVLPARRVLLLGLLPVASLVPGVSGVGLTLAVALIWGMTHEQAARLALLFVTPVLIAWGVRDAVRLPGADFAGVRAEVVVACGCALVAGYLAAALLVRYFRTASLRPFGYYCVLAGAGALAWLVR